VEPEDRGCLGYPGPSGNQALHFERERAPWAIEHKEVLGGKNLRHHILLVAVSGWGCCLLSDCQLLAACFFFLCLVSLVFWTAG
jgi:hypothetical protein